MQIYFLFFLWLNFLLILPIYIYKNINGSYQGCLLKQGCHLAAVGDLGSARTPRLAKIETAAFATCFRNVGK